MYAFLRENLMIVVNITLPLLVYVSYFTNEHFQDSLGWPLLLILPALVFIGLSTIAMRINRRYISNAQSIVSPSKDIQ